MRVGLEILGQLLVAALITGGLALAWCFATRAPDPEQALPLSRRDPRITTERPRDGETPPPRPTPPASDREPLPPMPLPEPLVASPLERSPAASAEARPASVPALPRAPQPRLAAAERGAFQGALPVAPGAEDLPRVPPGTPSAVTRAGRSEEAPSAPLRPGDVDREPRPRGAQPAPAYPARLLRRGRPPEGVVTLSFVIDAGGRVRDVEVESSRGPAEFRRAAREALAGWSFHPARKDGRPVAVQARKTFEFRAGTGAGR